MTTRAIKAPPDGAEGRCLHCPVRHASICAAVPLPLLTAHAASTTPLSCRRGEPIVDEGAPASAVFVLTAGLVKSQKSLPDGRLQILDFLLPGSLLALEIGGRYEHAVEAIVTARMCRISLAYLECLLNTVPGMWRRLIMLRATQSSRAHDRIVQLGRRSTTERLADFLLWLLAAQNDEQSPAQPGPCPAHLHVPMSRFEIADYLGMRFETVSRIFGQFKDAGAIAAAPACGIMIKDEAKLRDFAQHDERRRLTCG